MNNCLVTKLKAVVNNPNLPVLETMQQFTLDAIAASGNSNMTDAQKLALNHFFYEIGAISQDGVWNKINVLMIPMLATPVAGYNTYMVHDYKSNTTAFPSDSRLTGVNGGFESSVNLERPLDVPSVFVNSDAAAFIAMESAGHSVSSSKRLNINYNYADLTTMTIGMIDSTSLFIGRCSSGLKANSRIPLGDNMIMFALNIKGTPWNEQNIDYFAYNTNKEKIAREIFILDEAEAFIDHTGGTVTSTNMSIGSGTVVGLLMSFITSLTDAEIVKVCNAALALRSAFEVQNN